MLHRSAATGFAQGAADYVQGRPDYPPAIVGWLQQALCLAPGKTVADLGAGTGKFLPSLLATGAHTIAIEPVEAMRAQLASDYPQVPRLAAAAEALPLADASLDAVVMTTVVPWSAC